MSFHKFAFTGVFSTIPNASGAKVQNLGLTHGFKSNPEISKFTRLLMALPFLPASLISPTFNLITTPSLDGSEALMVGKLKKYIKKYWLTHISPEELSIFELSISTNNGAERYHSKLKARTRTSHPRIWSFLSQLNDIIIDTRGGARVGPGGAHLINISVPQFNSLCPTCDAFVPHH